MHSALSSVFHSCDSGTHAGSWSELVSELVVMAISSLGEGTQCAVPVDVLVLNLAAETDHFAYAQEITGVAADGVDSDPRLRGWMVGGAN